MSKGHGPGMRSFSTPYFSDRAWPPGLSKSKGKDSHDDKKEDKRSEAPFGSGSSYNYSPQRENSTMYAGYYPYSAPAPAPAASGYTRTAQPSYYQGTTYSPTPAPSYYTQRPITYTPSYSPAPAPSYYTQRPATTYTPSYSPAPAPSYYTPAPANNYYNTTAYAPAPANYYNTGSNTSYYAPAPANYYLPSGYTYAPAPSAYYNPYYTQLTTNPYQQYNYQQQLYSYLQNPYQYQGLGLYNPTAAYNPSYSGLYSGLTNSITPLQNYLDYNDFLLYGLSNPNGVTPNSIFGFPSIFSSLSKYLS